MPLAQPPFPTSPSETPATAWTGLYFSVELLCLRAGTRGSTSPPVRTLLLGSSQGTWPQGLWQLGPSISAPQQTRGQGPPARSFGLLSPKKPRASPLSPGLACQRVRGPDSCLHSCSLGIQVAPGPGPKCWVWLGRGDPPGPSPQLCSLPQMFLQRQSRQDRARQLLGDRAGAMGQVTCSGKLAWHQSLHYKAWAIDPRAPGQSARGGEHQPC